MNPKDQKSIAVIEEALNEPEDSEDCEFCGVGCHCVDDNIADAAWDRLKYGE